MPWIFLRSAFIIADTCIAEAFMKKIDGYKIVPRSTKDHGVAYDLYYRYKGKRYRPTLGYDLTREQQQKEATEVIKKIHDRGQTPRETESPADIA
jgi:hypothetical protein